MSLKNALLRPIEIKAGDIFVAGIDDGGFSTVTYNLDFGWWANVLTLGSALGADRFGYINFYFDSDFHAVCSVDSGTVSVGSTTVSRMLGFSGNESAGASVTADYRPMFSWVPTFYTKDTDRFIQDSGSLFYGSIGSDGRGSGIPMTAQYERTLEWTNEKAPNVMKEASNVSYDHSSTTYYPENERCFLNVLNSSRGSYSTASTSANVYSSGVYFIDILNRFLGETPDINAALITWDSGGILFDITDPDNRDNFAFTYVKNPVVRPTASDAKTASFYECTATLLTSTASTWETGIEAVVT